MEREEKSQDHFQLCIDVLLTAKNDTDKFAALLVVSKSMKAGECTTERRKQILDAVGVSFLTRLLRSEKTPDGCPLLMFKSVATTILSALLEDPDVASWVDMKKILPLLFDITKIDIREVGEEDRAMLEGVQRDAYMILARTACSGAGGRTLMETGCLPAMLHILCSRPPEDQMMRTMAIIVILLRSFGASLWSGAVNAYVDLFTLLVQYIITCKDESVFGACDLMTLIVRFGPETKSTPSLKSLQPLLEKLFCMLKSRLGVKQRQSVLVLLSVLVQRHGVSCVLPPALPSTAPFQLLLHLSCVEVRIATENSSPEELLEGAGLLTSLYHSLELMLDFLCGGDEDDDSQSDLPLDAAAFSQAHDALLHACNGVCFLLRQIDKGDYDVPLESPVVSASVRFVAAITAQAFSEVRDNVLASLPLFHRLCQAEVSQGECCGSDGKDLSQSLASVSLNTEEDRRTETDAANSCHGPADRLKDQGETEANTGVGGVKSVPQLGESDVLPDSFPGLMALTQRLWQPSASPSHHPPITVIQLLLPVYHLCLQDKEAQAEMVRLQTFCPLVQSALLVHSRLAGIDKAQESEACAVLGCLTEMVMEGCPVVNKNGKKMGEFQQLLQTAVKAVPSLDDNWKTYQIYLMASSLAVMTAEETTPVSDEHRETMAYLKCSAAILCQTFPALSPAVGKTKALRTSVWSEVKDIWVTCIQLMDSLVGLYPGVVDTFINHKFIAMVTTDLTNLKGGCLGSESKPVVAGFLEQLANLDARAKIEMQQTGGNKLARNVRKQKGQQKDQAEVPS